MGDCYPHKISVPPDSEFCPHLQRAFQAEAKLAEVKSLLRALRQQFHQAYHEGEPLSCRRSTCRAVSDFLGETHE